MSIIQNLDEEKKIVFVVWDGGVTAEEWHHYARRLVANPGWSTITRLLADLRTVQDTSTIHEEEINRAVEIYSANGTVLSGKKIAVIARDAFSKARYFGTSISRFGVSAVVFNDLDTACLFLGIDGLYAQQKLEETRAQLRDDSKS